MSRTPGCTWRSRPRPRPAQRCAEVADVRDLPRLAASFDVTRRGSGLHVSGQVSARVGQTCVVTLEPIESAVEEAVDLHSCRRADAVRAQSARKRSHGGDEPPEPLMDGRLDLGALATEFLILGIDPYPRKPGAEFAPLSRRCWRTTLCRAANLKKNLGGGQS